MICPDQFYSTSLLNFVRAVYRSMAKKPTRGMDAPLGRETSLILISVRFEVMKADSNAPIHLSNALSNRKQKTEN